MPALDFKGKSFVYAHHLSVPFRELRVDAKKSLPAAGRKPSLDDNLVIHGDNLEALKALMPTHAGKVDCIFIDPPYNTGNEGWCYNDNVRSPLMKEWLKKSANPVDKEDLERHDKWLCMMWPRLCLLRELLAEEGSIWVTLDDNEIHRFRGLMDEIFGEENFVTSIAWQKIFSTKNTARQFSESFDHVMVYAKRGAEWSPNMFERGEDQAVRYSNPDNDPRGPWTSGDCAARNPYSAGLYPITTPSGRVIDGPPRGAYWRFSESKFGELDKDGRIWWGKDGGNIPRVKRFRSEVKEGLVPETWWTHEFAGHTQEAKRELIQVLAFETNDDVFITPKPLRLLSRIVELATDKNSLILDSFAGSGTTGHAVLAANAKDGGNRRFILIECEDYADTLTAERVRRVIGGYKFTGTQRTELMSEKLTWTAFKRAPELLEKVESIAQLEGAGFDSVKREIKDGVLTVTGERKIAERAPGLGGSFTFATLGDEMSLAKLLASGLPTFEALAKYVFYTATGRTLAEVPKPKPATLGFIGETEMYRVHLHYKAEKQWLQSNEAALTEKRVDAMLAANGAKKRLLIFAASKFIGQRELTKRGVEFCQLPYAIHRILGE